MVRAMAFDRGPLPRVAWLTLLIGGSSALLFACGPTVKPGGVPSEPRPIAQGQSRLKADPQGRRVLVGEMCPQGAGGRPAVAPLVLRGATWSDTPGEVAATVERGVVPRFVVFGVDGKQAGAFDTLGLVDIAPGQSVASGAYVGASPCTYSVTAKPTPGQLDTRGEDPKCGQATKSCGIAVAEITNPDEPTTMPAYTTGGACMAGNDLTVDIDGDGVLESFPIANVLDGIRAPAAEWLAGPTAAPASTAPCTPTFQLYDLKLAAEPRTARAPAPVRGGTASASDSVVTVDVLAVVDLDGDGRRELVLAMKFATVRSIVVYTATENVQRLELAGEGQSFR